MRSLNSSKMVVIGYQTNHLSPTKFIVGIRNLWTNAFSFRPQRLFYPSTHNRNSIFTHHKYRSFSQNKDSSTSSSFPPKPSATEYTNSRLTDLVDNLDRVESYDSLTPPSIITADESEMSESDVPKSPFMTEDVRLSRVSITGYGADYFDVHFPSALSQSANLTSNPDISLTQVTLSSPFASHPKDKTPSLTINATFPSTQAEVNTSVIPSSVDSSQLRNEAASTLPFAAGIFGQSDTIAMKGSIIALPNLVLLWSPQIWSDVTPSTLSFLTLINPKPELILLGSGSSVQPISSILHSYLTDLNINYEVFSSSSAAATFNLLNEEDRFVVAGMLPMGDTPNDETVEEKEKKKKMQRPSYWLRQKIDKQLGQISQKEK